MPNFGNLTLREISFVAAALIGGVLLLHRLLG
jgi:hypothetical protein